MKKLTLLSLLIITNVFAAVSQSFLYDLQLEPVTIPALPGIQSYAFGQHDGKWLLVGGRLDGLHKRQPFAAFDIAGLNTNLTVVDPVTAQVWTAPLTSLPVGLQEQLSSTNMEFYQEDSMLYCIGGYGYSNTAVDHITYNNLAAINIPQVMDAIINGTTFSSAIRQITDPQFAVTGGRLEKIYNTWYLVGGQKFDGRYNPMNHATYVQVYSNQIRKFLLNDNGTTITVTHLAAITDTVNLHRRDYNVLAQIMPNGEEGLTAFSGVFQTAANVPYLNCVNIDSNGYAVNNAFAQYYNHYHCANLPLYSQSSNVMHNIFFGGIAQYYDNAGVLVQDNNVPFVKTIARVARDGNGFMSEHKMPVEMPSLLGAGSEFIPETNLPAYQNHVLKLDSILSDTTLLGYVYGGISSTAANVFFSNGAATSAATSQVFKVSLIKNAAAGVPDLNEQSTGSLQMQIYPNPNDGIITIVFNMKTVNDLKIKITDLKGNILKYETVKNLSIGKNQITYNLMGTSKSGNYMITLETTNEVATQRVIIK